MFISRCYMRDMLEGIFITRIVEKTLKNQWRRWSQLQSVRRIDHNLSISQLTKDVYINRRTDHNLSISQSSQKNVYINRPQPLNIAKLQSVRRTDHNLSISQSSQKTCTFNRQYAGGLITMSFCLRQGCYKWKNPLERRVVSIYFLLSLCK